MASSSDEAKPVAKPEQNDLYCWPWVGIVANILDEPKKVHYTLANWMMNALSKYNALEIEMYPDDENKNKSCSAIKAVVRFDDGWTGFKNAMNFEKSFEANGRGRNGFDRDRREASLGSNVYGWLAREDDYRSKGPLGECIRSKGELKTISDIIQEGIKDMDKALGDLVSKIGLKRESLDLHRAVTEEIRKLQPIAREPIKKALDEQDMLNEHKALTELARQQLEDEKRKNDLRNNSLQMASEEQNKADQNVLRMAEEQKIEKEEAVNPDKA